MEVGVQYRWDFDDGTPVTPFSSSATITHQFAEPGIYYVTVTVRDSCGTTQSTTIVQTVHYPLTPTGPRFRAISSSRIAPRVPDRLWVVNQDKNSVTVLNTSTGSRIKQITVGNAPRSIAIASTGEVWVTNKRSPSISVISPSSHTVTRTISMPLGSQPHGIAASPTGGFMYVALEGTGRLLKLDAIDVRDGREPRCRTESQARLGK